MSELEQYRSGLEKKLKTYLEKTEKYIDEIVLLVGQKDGIDTGTLEIHKEALKSFQLE